MKEIFKLLLKVIQKAFYLLCLTIFDFLLEITFHISMFIANLVYDRYDNCHNCSYCRMRYEFKLTHYCSHNGKQEKVEASNWCVYYSDIKNKDFNKTSH